MSVPRSTSQTRKMCPPIRPPCRRRRDAAAEARVERVIACRVKADRAKAFSAKGDHAEGAISLLQDPRHERFDPFHPKADRDIAPGHRRHVGRVAWLFL